MKRRSKTGPKVVLLAGPNGAGKSTLAPALLRDTLHVSNFVNADVIARGLSAYAAESQAIAAGRIMLARLRDLAERRFDFAFETTLASRSLAPWIDEICREHGYELHLVFIWLRTPAIAAARVKARTRMGGHDVPTEVIERRHARSVRNFFDLYAGLAGTWRVYDNSGARGKLVAASGQPSRTSPRKKIESAPDIAGIFSEGTEVDLAFGRAIREARREHKRAGNPVPVLRRGKVVWIPASRIRP